MGIQRSRLYLTWTSLKNCLLQGETAVAVLMAIARFIPEKYKNRYKLKTYTFLYFKKA